MASGVRSLKNSVVPRPAGTLSLSENQEKVIGEKYLRDDPSVEVWLRRIARNIALAELLYATDSGRWDLLRGVRRQQTWVPTRGDRKSRLLLLHERRMDAEERDKNFKRFLRNLTEVARTHPVAGRLVSEWEERFYAQLSRFDFLPNSPTLMNAGRELQQLSACYVLPVGDSMEGITNALKAQALIHQSGGGTGFSFGQLRPSGDAVRSTHGIASGAISFMQIYDKMTDVIKQGGARRGANMGILPYWHPEIREFIALKSKPGVMENFNISVGIDAAFMKAVREHAECDLINPRTGQPVGRVQAREIFDRMVEYAWRTGDPGYVVLDRINGTNSNPTPALGMIEATNPCGEQALLPYEPCNLGSLNLSHFVEGPPLAGSIQWGRLKETISVAVRFLDNVIDVNNYPLTQIEAMAKGNRRIGLGIMGWAETLVKLGIPYDSTEALAKAQEVMKFIDGKALEASEALAEERGAFPNFKDSIYDESGSHFRGRAARGSGEPRLEGEVRMATRLRRAAFPRHCARTTLAPTGTIALAAGLQGSGIEPFFSLCYIRYNARALDALREGRQPNPQDVYAEMNPLFREVAETHRFFGLAEEDLRARVEAHRKSVRGIPEIPERIQRIFATAHDVSPEFHVRMQAAFQEHTDNGISKTINLPFEATVEDVRSAFLLAYDLGCKGITIYRDGSKARQVLNLAEAGAFPRCNDPECA